MPIGEKPENSLSLSARIEALLFVAPGAVTPAQLASALGASVAEIDAGLLELENFLLQRALRLQSHRGSYQLTTAPEVAPLIETFLNLDSTFRMTRAALETLAIIAYQQPVTKPHIDAIRGVNSDTVLRNLLSKGLIEEAGRAEGPGRPIFYTTSAEFLQHFGLNRLEDLPSLSLEPEASQSGGPNEPGQNGQGLDLDLEPRDDQQAGPVYRSFGNAVESDPPG
jgi:segregation and condensation protein B